MDGTFLDLYFGYKSSTCRNFSEKNQIDVLLALKFKYFLYGGKRVLKSHKGFDQNHEEDRGHRYIFHSFYFVDHISIKRALN